MCGISILGGVGLPRWRLITCKRPLVRLAISVVILAALCVGILLSAQTRRVTVHAWDRQISVSTRAATVGDVLAGLSLSIDPGDLVDPPLETQVENDLEIKINRASPVFIHWKGKSFPVFTAENHVSKILSLAHIEKGPDDVVYPGLDEELSGQRVIKVAQVTYAEVKEKEEIPYETRKHEDNSLDVGFTKVVKPGVTGLIEVIYEVKYEDGKEVSRKEKSRIKLRNAAPLLLAVGTRQMVSRGGRDIRFKRSLEVTATAYCPCAKCCGSSAKGTTATGVPAARGVIAVDPRVIPLGSRVYVDGYGYAVAADVGSSIKGNKIDVCFDTHEEALAWGYKRTKVYILP